MTRKSVFLSLALLVCLPLSCTVLTETHVDAPPKEGGAAADKWWETTVDSLPLPFLAVYAEVSDIHLRKKTSATYIDWYEGAAMGVNVSQCELQLPSPPPPAAFARMRERLQGFKVTPEALAADRRKDHVIMAEACQGCALHQAMELWLNAEKKVNPTKVKPVVPTIPATRPI